MAVDTPVETDEVTVPSGTPLSAVASAAGCSTKDIEALNLELRAGRTPPAPPSPPGTDAAVDVGYVVRVPAGKGLMAVQNLAKTRRDAGQLERYVVKFGESLEQIAAARKVPLSRLVELNAIAQGEVVRGGTVILVPRTGVQPPPSTPATAAVAAKGAAHGRRPVRRLRLS